ncbi:hypothetical protein MRX96_002308 [Rhipicephalus microplus]
MNYNRNQQRPDNVISLAQAVNPQAANRNPLNHVAEAKDNTIQSLRNENDQLKRCITEQRAQMQEINAKSFAKPSSARTVGKDAGQGVCTLVKKNLSSIDRELLPNGAIEHSMVEMVTGKRKRRESTFIINVYSNPKYFQEKFRTLVHKAQQLVDSNVTLLCGDFNAKHTA